MFNLKILGAAAAAGFAFAIFVLISTSSLLAQDRPGRNPTAKEKEMSAVETRGEGLFLQRCSVCHLPRILKFGSPPVVGPNLSGVFNQASPGDTKILRQFILKGSPNMPGFQFGLDSTQMDDLIAYLKTL
jgi:mono/diheme cytochrome c family protein